MAARTPGRPVAPGTVGRRWTGLSSAGEFPSLTGAVVAGILMLAPWGPAAALGIRAFTVSSWHTATILLQKPCGKSVGWCWYPDQTFQKDLGHVPSGQRQPGWQAWSSLHATPSCRSEQLWGQRLAQLTISIPAGQPSSEEGKPSVKNTWVPQDPSLSYQ